MPLVIFGNKDINSGVVGRLTAAYENTGIPVSTVKRDPDSLTRVVINTSDTEGARRVARKVGFDLTK